MQTLMALKSEVGYLIVKEAQTLQKAPGFFE
jgi:hypothetical protein